MYLCGAIPSLRVRGLRAPGVPSVSLTAMMPTWRCICTGSLFAHTHLPHSLPLLLFGCWWGCWGIAVQFVVVGGEWLHGNDALFRHVLDLALVLG